MLDALPARSTARRPSVLAVAPWAAAGWLAGGLLAVVPPAFIAALGGEVGDTVWQPTTSGGAVVAVALVAALAWGVALAQRVTLRPAGPVVAWTRLAAWATPLAVALLAPELVALAAVVVGIGALPWLLWDDEGVPRPELASVPTAAARALAVAVPLLAVAAVALAV